MQDTAASLDQKSVPVWDIPTRLFHWCLAGLVVILWFSGTEGNLDVHMTAGYVLLSLILFRLIWGVVGSQTARFSDFVRGPGPVLNYLYRFSSNEKTFFAGHNPAGGWMVMALLSVLLLQGGSGLFSEDNLGIENGPLAHLVSGSMVSWATYIHTHVTLVILYILIPLHILAALVYLLVKRENLIGAMITGRKKVSSDIAAKPVGFVSPLWAVVALIIAGAVVWGGLSLL